MKPVIDVSKERFIPNPYVDWTELLADNLPIAAAPPDQAEYIRPIFVQAKNPTDDVGQFFRETGEIGGVLFDRMEKEINYRPQNKQGTIEAVLYVPACWTFREDASAALIEKFHLLYVGPRVTFKSGEINYGIGGTPKPADSTIPMMAGIIDDGIAYLNSRFRNGNKTRFKSLWIQTVPQASINENNVRLGAILREEWINRQLDNVARTSETELYCALRKDVPILGAGLPLGLARTVEARASHGTHMLDVAAGADPSDDSADEMRDIPILGVQLPPQSVDDTSGVRLEIHAIQALRWMIHEAARLRVKKLVVNLSFGAAAGSKDGNSFMEQQMAREVGRAKRKGLIVHLVLPFGNEYDSRLVAMHEVAAGHTTTVEIRLPRADETPTFLEISATNRSADLGKIEILLTSPTGETTQAAAGPILTDAGHQRALLLDGQQVGLIYNVVDQSPPPATGIPDEKNRKPYRPKIVIAFAPTAEPRAAHRSDGNQMSLTPPGRWSVHLVNRDTAGRTLVLQIQRDDSAFGYRRPGQQATFDHPDAYEQSTLFRDQSELAEHCPITHSTTNTAYVGITSDRIHSVGAARDYHFSSENRQQPAPAYYTSQGKHRFGGDPSGSMVVETSSMHPGVLASGTVSGSTVRLSGTSVAAAGYTRQLLLASDDVVPAGITSADGDLTRLGPETLPIPMRSKRIKSPGR